MLPLIKGVRLAIELPPKCVRGKNLNLALNTYLAPMGVIVSYGADSPRIQETFVWGI